MKNKIILSLFIVIMLIGIVLPAGETTTTTIEKGTMKEIFANILGNGINVVEGENGNTITFLDGGSLNISGVLYENVTESSSIELNNAGNITFADLTASKNTTFILGGTEYKIPKGGRIKYEEGKPAIFYGDSLEFKEGSSDKFTKVNLLGESLKFEKIGESNIITGNVKIGNDEFKGLDENVGKITLSKDGRITEIWKGTDATMKNVNFKVSGDNLKMYYDENFVASSHANENYFNYGKNKINVGGTGFSSNLGKTNNIFGDMKVAKEVKGIGTKTRDLGFTLNGGNLEISKDMSINDDLSFNVKGDGDYIINNGRAVIYSQKGYVKDNKGKYVLSDENIVFVKENYKDGLSYSYDINFNNDEYTLKSNVFTNKKGNVFVNLNNEWEDYIRKINERDINEINKLKEEINGEKGVNARDYAYLLKDREGLVKMFVEARDSANKNILGTKLSMEELVTRYMLEGGALYQDGYPVYVYDHEGLNTEIYGSRIGLDYIGEANSLEELKKYKLIPENFQIKSLVEMRNEQYQDTTTAYFYNIKDSITAFAGEFTRRKAVFERDFKEAYGEQDFNLMADDEKYFWLTKYENSGEAAGKGELTGTKYTAYSSSTGEKIVVQGKGRENVYKSWTGPEPGQWGSGASAGSSSLFNAVLSEATYKLFKLSKIFSYV